MRLTGAPASVDEARSAVRGAARIAAGSAVSGFSAGRPAASGRRRRGGARRPRARAGGGRARGRLRSAARRAHGSAGDDCRGPGAARRGTASRLGRPSRGRRSPSAWPRSSRASLIQRETGALKAFAPLPRIDPVDQPSTGYDDVRTIALARLMCATIPSIQVDWPLYGPKLAQVAIAFGADDIDRRVGVRRGGARTAAARRARRLSVRSGWRSRSRSSGTAGSSAVHDPSRAPRRGRLPERPAARLGLPAGAAPGLEPEVSVRFDLPAVCATLLDAGGIDLGLVPSIAYLDRPEFRVVPDIGIVSDGPVASVALFARRPLPEVRSLALDTSSRTSAALTRILCARVFGIAPVFVPHPPDLPRCWRRTTPRC